MGQICSDRWNENTTSVDGNETNIFNTSASVTCVKSNATFKFDIGKAISEGIKALFDNSELANASWLILNYMRVIFPIGFLANMTTLLVLGHMRPWKAWKVYVAVLAVSDTLVLFLKFLSFELGIPTKFARSQHSNCHVLLYFGVTMTEFSHWVLVFMTLHRLFIIWFPLRMNGEKLNRVFGLLFGLGLIIPSSNIVYFWIKGDAWNSMTFDSCKPLPKYEDVVERYWKWIRSAIYGIVPCFLVVVANFGVITGWMLSNRRHRQLTGPNNTHGSSAQDVAKHLQITAMILSTSACFALVVVPHTMFMIVADISANAENIGHEALKKVITVMFADVNYCCNFFLYLASSSDFRHKVAQLIFRRSCRGNKPKPSKKT